MNSREADPDWLRSMAVAVRAIAVVGVILFGALAILVSMAPASVERAARGYVSQRLESELQALTGGSVALSGLIGDSELRERVAEQLARLNNKLPESAEHLLAKFADCLCLHDCAARTKARAIFDAVMAVASEETRALVLNLGAVAQGRFDTILGKLRHELILNFSLNAAIFGILLLATFRARGKRTVVVPAALLTLSTIISVGVYLIGTNWWWAVLTDGYWGMGYLLFDAIVMLFLLDIICFEGRVTEGLINAIADLFSNVFPQC